MKYTSLILLSFLFFFIGNTVIAQEHLNTNRFRQLAQELPTPNEYRNAAGAPGKSYFQQKVDYIMRIELDEVANKISGAETITYHNNSPDNLAYLWLQLDQNMRAKDSDTYKIRNSKLTDKSTVGNLRNLIPTFDGGFKIKSISDISGKALTYVVNKTMMRIDLPQELSPGESFEFKIDYWYNINNRMKIGGRSGYEYFEEDQNSIFMIAQFFPRLCVYNDVDGWQNKQFLGRGEFTLEFGDYEVAITVPADHLIASTGELQNKEAVLSAKQIKRLNKASTSFEQPVVIQTQEEAEKAEKNKSIEQKTWIFKAKNVRDFAFATSRKFIWDEMAVKQTDGSIVRAASMYPKEGNPLWGQYSSKAVAHAVKWYSHYTFDYPYPIAWSISGDKIGMEYPMISFNPGRCEKDGSYSEQTKYRMISVVIHEVGHNYFPMIVNSDERQWTWMDEGLTSFLQYLAEQQWERNYPSRRGPAYKITDYMGGNKERISPIMTNSESIWQFGNNAYGKPATGLNILRETIMGRELFDMAFKTYSNRWKFKQPMPADFFRSMEDASAVDLDWFWRAWFFTNDHVDQELTQVIEKVPNDGNPILKENAAKASKNKENQYISNIRNAAEIKQTYDEIDPSLKDFYSSYDANTPTEKDKANYKEQAESMSNEDKNQLISLPYYYEISISDKGGVPMPVILQFHYEDGSEEVIRIPVEIWKLTTDQKITKVFPTSKRVDYIVLDPFLETADINTLNNYFPSKKPEPTRFKVFKQKKNTKTSNPMQNANDRS